MRKENKVKKLLLCLVTTFSPKWKNKEIADFFLLKNENVVGVLKNREKSHFKRYYKMERRHNDFTEKF